MKKSHSYKIRKIALEELIDVLMKIYEQGAVFIDIEVLKGHPQDMINIRVKEEYFDEDSIVMTDFSEFTTDELKQLI
jgi:hypothetical protein